MTKRIYKWGRVHFASSDLLCKCIRDEEHNIVNEGKIEQKLVKMSRRKYLRLMPQTTVAEYLELDSYCKSY